MATAITAAMRNPNARRARSGRSPATVAKSTLTVAASKGRHIQYSTPSASTAASPDDGQIASRHPEDVPEEQSVQVEPNAGKEGEDYQSDGEAAMGEQTEQGVGRQRVAAFEVKHHYHDGASAGEDAGHQMNIEQDSERDPEQGGVRDRLSEVREASPHDETSRRSGDERQADTGEQSAGEEVVQHGSVRRAPVIIDGRGRGGVPRRRSPSRVRGAPGPPRRHPYRTLS